MTPTVTKVAAGAVEHVQIAVVPGVPGALQELERLGVWTVGLDERGPEPMFGLQLGDRPIALVIGAEGRGLAPLSRQRCDVLARIPLHGSIDSLNVSAAGAVVLYEAFRQRRNAAHPLAGSASGARPASGVASNPKTQKGLGKQKGLGS